MVHYHTTKNNTCWLTNPELILRLTWTLFSFSFKLFYRDLFLYTIDYINITILHSCSYCWFFQIFYTSGRVCVSVFVCGLSFCTGCHGLLPRVLQLSLDCGWTCSPLCQRLVSAGKEGREIITCWNLVQAQLQCCEESFPLQEKMTFSSSSKMLLWE